MTLSKKTVRNTVEQNLCVSCGICKSICPVDCIKMKSTDGQYVPEVDESKCTECGKCYRVCPGIEVDYEKLYNYKSGNYPEDIFSGEVKDAYITYSKDEYIRKEGRSGGVVSDLLIKILEDGLIEKAYVVDCDVYDGEEVKSTAAVSKDEVISAAKSEYLPVSMENMIDNILEHPDEKIAVVGTSCHFHGIHKVLVEEDISENDIYFFGLFCEKTLNLNLIDFYRDNYSKNDEKIQEFNYRDKGDNGWPGNSKILFDSEREEFIDRKIRMWLKPYFQLNRCLFCIDKLNQLADISFGDCYIEGEESHLGKSNIVIRSEKGERAFEKCKENVEYKSVAIDKIFQSQNIQKKTENLYFDIVRDGEKVNNINQTININFDESKLKNRLIFPPSNKN